MLTKLSKHWVALAQFLRYNTIGSSVYPANIIFHSIFYDVCFQQAIDAPNRRLELRFRPDDGYSKPTCGDRHGATGFLLRIRIKKNRVKRNKEDATVNTIDPHHSVEAVNSGTFFTVPGKTNMFHLLENGQIDDLMLNTAVTRDNYRSDVGDSANQTQDCDINSTNPSDEDAEKDTGAVAITADLRGKDTDKDARKGKKDTLPIFDRDKYENLSGDTDYELPRLKVLGRIDVEFKFTSTFYTNAN